jgi:sulfite reductase beta subunit-like hemoprotein
LTAEELEIVITNLRVEKLKKELKRQVDSVVRSEQRNASSRVEDDYEAIIRQDEAKKVPGLGDDGVPVILQGEEAKRAEELMKVEAFNILLSDKIPYSRRLPDARNLKYVFFVPCCFLK